VITDTRKILYRPPRTNTTEAPAGVTDTRNVGRHFKTVGQTHARNLAQRRFGFFGVVVYTRVQTPRFWGDACKCGALVLYFFLIRAPRISWFISGTSVPSFYSDPRCKSFSTNPALAIQALHNFTPRRGLSLPPKSWGVKPDGNQTDRPRRKLPLGELLFCRQRPVCCQSASVACCSISTPASACSSSPVPSTSIST